MSDVTGGPESPTPEPAPMPSPPADGVMPPPTAPESPTPDVSSETQSPWPGSAKTWVAILAVLALLGGIGAIVGFSQASSSDGDKADVESDLDAANARAVAAEQERDDVSIQYAETAASLSDVTAERDQAASERDAAISERDEAVAANDTLETELAAETARADEAQAALDEVAEAFPLSVDTSLVGLDVAGSYSVSFTEAYCDFATGCGATPNADSAVIGVTPEGFLDFTVDGILEAGLFAVNGGLYGITDSETAIPPCGDTARRGRVTITIFPADVTVAADGTRTVSTLEASITLDAPTLGECPSGLVFWGAVLTPTG